MQGVLTNPSVVIPTFFALFLFITAIALTAAAADIKRKFFAGSLLSAVVLSALAFSRLAYLLLTR